jgi:hypothetical protein
MWLPPSQRSPIQHLGGDNTAVRASAIGPVRHCTTVGTGWGVEENRRIIDRVHTIPIAD